MEAKRLVMNQMFHQARVDRTFDKVVKCEKCQGTGSLEHEVGPASIQIYEEVCKRCAGSGKINLSIFERWNRINKIYF